jgi:hypothetical protein
VLNWDRIDVVAERPIPWPPWKNEFDVTITLGRENLGSPESKAVISRGLEADVLPDEILVDFPLIRIHQG